jgi:hypothetical protein
MERLIMAYMNQEKKAVIAAKLKPILKKYGVKGTLSVRNHSSIVLNVKSGKIDFIENYLADGKCKDESFVRRYGSVDVNPYWFQDHFTGVSKKFLTEAFDALKSAGYYDNSDAQTDYFDTAYYYDINIGKWNKPYALTA